MRLIILGTPITKKNSGRIITNRSTGKPLLLPSAQAKRWASIAVYQLADQWRYEPMTVATHVKATFYRERAAGDLVNFMQALADALEAAKVVTNDRLIESWDGTRLDKDANNPRVELDVMPLHGGILLTPLEPRRPGLDLLDPALHARWKAKGEP
jgi:Holliday junction resolvase RusA-like endonuclease